MAIYRVVLHWNRYMDTLRSIPTVQRRNTYIETYHVEASSESHAISKASENVKRMYKAAYPQIIRSNAVLTGHTILSNLATSDGVDWLSDSAIPYTES